MEVTTKSWEETTLNVSLLIPTPHNGFLLLPAGKEKQPSYPIYFLTPSTNVNDLICLLPLHGTYQALTNTTSYVLFQEYLANQMTLTLKLPRTQDKSTTLKKISPST